MIGHLTLILLTSIWLCNANEFAYTELSEAGYIKYADLAFALVNPPLLRFLGFKKAQEHGHELLQMLVQAFLDEKKLLYIAVKKTILESDKYKTPEKTPRSITYQLAQLTAVEYTRQEGQTTTSAAITLHIQIPVSKTYNRTFTVVPIQDHVLINVYALAPKMSSRIKGLLNDYFTQECLNICLQ